LPIQYSGKGGAGGIALLRVLAAAVVIAAGTAAAGTATAAVVVGGTDALSVVSGEGVLL
jgi:hypothetical protein